ncbi:MAG: haloacid dehalogenase type II [Proteobacteria bacterium]|nr:haloacid dehalogenase type II [Pseudomonadota bacterium]
MTAFDNSNTVDIWRRHFLGASATATVALASAPLPFLAGISSVRAAEVSALPGIQAILFDVQGTIVDFYSTLVTAGDRMGANKGISADWDGVINDWRKLYRQGLDEVIGGKRAWVTTDVIYREALDTLLSKYPWGATFSAAERDELNGIWRRLTPWEDTIPGLTRLRKHYTLSTLSNGSMASVIGIVKNGNLPFDCVLTSELARSFKPDPKVYQLATSSFGLPPEKILMVACHKYDLKAAKALGFKVAFIPRPLEFGPKGKVDLAPEPYFDLFAKDLNDLARTLGS